MSYHCLESKRILQGNTEQSPWHVGDVIITTHRGGHRVDSETVVYSRRKVSCVIS